MLTYDLTKAPGQPLYEALYRALRQEIQAGVLPQGMKLPSKRALAQNLQISTLTVETAYAQLVSEGYLRSQERVGYFVEGELPPSPPRPPAPAPVSSPEPLLDLTDNSSADFPFSVWSRLQRQVLLDLRKELLRPLDNRGCLDLRRAIAAHLSGFRGMQVDPENILVGAGTDFLYNLLIQLLGRDRRYAVEEPGYGKIPQIYAAGGADWFPAPMDDQGVLPQALGAHQVLHISPAHHFPTGTVTSLSRRQALLRWAETQDGYIIEDDYDSEFRFRGRPLPALQTMDRQGRVIYMNSFSKSLAPSIRIGYMILPPALSREFSRRLGFYSCTVASFEQYTLARFIAEGNFEKHLNRLRKFYKSRRDRVAAALNACPWADKMTLLDADAGLHFLLKVDTALTDRELVALWASRGIRVRPLSAFYHGEPPESAQKTLLINYSGLDEGQLFRLQMLPNWEEKP